MFDETFERSAGDTPRRSAPGQLRLQLPQQSAPVERGRRPEGYDATHGGATANGLLGILGQSLDDLFPF
ncbi:hypothetical protein [Streptomyces sp. NPDC002825]|uniref:hypothetical protein n=1 Tax=Streptomyces sp. NPDC002825 TaxID=3154666 RepID=UPI00332B63CC